jgi:hypothetical protein
VSTAVTTPNASTSTMAPSPRVHLKRGEKTACGRKIGPTWYETSYEFEDLVRVKRRLACDRCTAKAPPWEDTPQQKAILRSSRTARAMRKRFSYGQRVQVYAGAGSDETAGVQGTVYRHVPGLDAQGGVVVVDLDTGVRARKTASSLRPVKP